MKTIIIFVSRDKFTDGFISFFEKYFSKYYRFIFYTLKSDEFALKKHNSEIYEIDKFMDIFFGEAEKNLFSCDAFIISGLFVHIKRGFRVAPVILDKMWINFWGGDYTCFRKRYFWKDPLGYIIRRRRLQLIKGCAGWIMEMEGDYNEIRKHAGVDKKAVVAPILSPRDVEIQELKITKTRKTDDKMIILIGNSAAPENCHIEVLKTLKHLKDENIKVICPLSYGGNAKYINRVIKVGNEIFEKKFYAVLQFLPKDEYFELFNSIDVAIFNNNRQQGMGNIEEMLRQGKKVYLRTTTPMWNWYRGRGQKIHDVKELKNISLEKLAEFPQELAQRNVDIDMELRNSKWALNLWGNLLLEITK